MPNPDYFSYYSPKSSSDEYPEKEDEQKEKDVFNQKNLKKDIILD